jgi:hypothetical protein
MSFEMTSSQTMEFYIQSGSRKLNTVSTESVDDFYYFRDSIHDALEEGAFGSKFPIFMCRFEPDEWKVEELDRLQGELETIAEAFKGLPPEPFDSHWRGRLAASTRRYSSLYDVFVDKEGKPLLGRLIDLCRVARREQKAIVIR